MSVHVDQTKELACLSDIINAFEDRRRIMLLRGDKGSGKTAFLGKAFTLYEELTPIAWSDLRQLSDPIELMDNLANQFRTQDVALERYFDASLMEERHIHVAVTNSRLKGSPVDVSVERSAREDRVRGLLTQIMDDLDKWTEPPRRLILLDNYEDASPTLAQWLQGTFIQRIAYNRSTVCVIAGSQLPDPSSLPVQQRTAEFALNPLEECDIREWLIAEGLDGDEREASFLWKGSLGIPGFVAAFIANAASKKVDRE